jgi:transposase
MTFVAALRHDRTDAPWLIDGPINGERFRLYVEKMLGPSLRPGDIVILDNLGSHKGSAVRRAIRSAGARLFFLPKYSPDLNPIEQLFAKLKHLLRKAGERTVDAVCNAIGQILGTITPQECRNYVTIRRGPSSDWDESVACLCIGANTGVCTGARGGAYGAGSYSLAGPERRRRFSITESIDLNVSTLADWVGASAAALSPLVELIRRHVLNAQRIHGDDTTVPVLAKGKTVTGRLWTYVRDDRPFGGPHLDGTGPPAALYFYSRNRDGEHPRRHLADYGGILQADAFAGFNALYEPSRKPGPITEAACWSHAGASSSCWPTSPRRPAYLLLAALPPEHRTT